MMIKYGIFLVFLFFAYEVLTYPANEDEILRPVKTYNGKILSSEEIQSANAARAKIAKVLERNLLRLFAAVVIEEKREARQQLGGLGGGVEEEEEDEGETATINPNTLPQVAALLGAIFSGNINLTNVVDKAFYLVPDAVRNQVTGLFKIIGGVTTGGSISNSETPSKSPSNSQSPPSSFIPHPLDTTTEGLLFIEENSNSTEGDLISETSTVKVADVRTTRAPEPELAPFGSVFKEKEKKLSGGKDEKLTTKTKIEEQFEPELFYPIASSDDFIDEEEIQRTERELLEMASEYNNNINYNDKSISDNKLINDDGSRGKEGRFLLVPLREIFKSGALNLTTVFRVMPDLFKGARQTYNYLENLGVLPDIGLDLDDDEN